MCISPLLQLIVPEDYMIPCMNKKLFGVECPGCGLQRSVALLFKGNFVGAFKMYPAIYPILLFLLVLGVFYFVKFKFANQIKMILGITAALTVIVSYIIKMNHFLN